MCAQAFIKALSISSSILNTLSVTMFFLSTTGMSDVIRKNKVKDILIKMELDMDQASVKALVLFHDKKC